MSNEFIFVSSNRVISFLLGTLTKFSFRKIFFANELMNGTAMYIVELACSKCFFIREVIGLVKISSLVVKALSFVRYKVHKNELNSINRALCEPLFF